MWNLDNIEHKGCRFKFHHCIKIPDSCKPFSQKCKPIEKVQKYSECKKDHFGDIFPSLDINKKSFLSQIIVIATTYPTKIDQIQVLRFGSICSND